MEKRKFLLAIWIFWFSHNCPAQLPNLYFHHLTVEQGLSQALNLFVHKDSKGYVWISSVNGLNQFDGQTVRVHLPNPERHGAMLGDNIQGPFFEDSAANIWFATFEGINCYDRKADNFRHFFLKDEQGMPVPSYFTLGLDTTNGLLWVVHRTRHVYTLDTRTGEFNYLHDVAPETHRGMLLPGQPNENNKLLTYSLNTPGLQVSHYNMDGKMTSQHSFFDGNDGTAKHSFRDGFVGKNGLSWFNTSSGLLSFDARTGAYTIFPFSKNNSPTLLSGIAPLPNGMIACASSSDGLWAFDPNRQTFTGSLRHIPDAAHTLNSNHLDGVHTDQDGVLWVSVGGFGLSYASFEKTKFEEVFLGNTPLAGSGNLQFSNLLQDRSGRIWCLTEVNGIFVFDKNKQLLARYARNAKPPFDLPYDKNYHLFEDGQGRIWLSYQTGLSVLYPGRQRFEVADRSDGYLFGLQLRDGRLLFSRFQGGVWEMQENQNGQFTFAPLAIPDPASVWTLLYEDNDNRLWGNYNLAGIAAFDPDSTGYRQLAEWPMNGRASVFFHHKKAEKMWVATSPGLYGISTKNLKLTEKRLENLAVNSLLSDGEETLWLGTNQGLRRLNTRTRAVESYGTSDGLSSLECGYRSVVRLDNGSVLFGTMKSLVASRLEMVQPISAKALPQITELTLNDTLPLHLNCALTGASNPSEMQEIRLRHNENLLGFTLSSLEYSDPANCRIRYRLHGADPDTVEVRSGAQVRYPNLPPGVYHLQVWASNSDGIWNPVPHELTIRIRPAFWQTVWFKLLLALAFVGVVYSFFHVRDKERQRLQQLRNRLSRDLHDELGSTLSSISILSESAKHATATGQQGLSLEQIGQRAREALENVSDLVWAIKPQNDPLPAVLRRMRLFSAETLEPLGMNVRFKASNDLGNLHLPSEQRKELYLIFKEAVTNCAKYSQATAVHISIEKKGNTLVLSIHDNGAGFDTAYLREAEGVRYGGNGLRNMQARADALKAGFFIESSPGNGTSVSLELPLVP